MHIVMTSSASMPALCCGQYRYVAVVQLNQEFTAMNLRPAMISERARGVLRLIWKSPPSSVGKTDGCAYRRALAYAEDMALRLNSAADMATIEQIIGAGGAA